MNNYKDILDEINGNNSFTKISDLKVNEKYLVTNIERTHYAYGSRVIITCGDMSFQLPESWNERMTSKNINALLKSDKPLYVIYCGKIPLPNDKFKHDLKFVIE